MEKFARTARRQLHEQVSARLERVLRTDSAELREHAAAVQTLKEQVKAHGKAAVVERAAYTWFNRFCALRFMDANRYTPIGVVSPAAGFTLPEILQEAKQGVIDEDLPVERQRVAELLGGRLPARDAQQEAYRLLLVAACNRLHAPMPYLFEPIADYTELLLPDDLLSEASILQEVRETLTADVCQDEEGIGWLYQFYIADKKEEVDTKVKAGGKVEADELPAKTALYTPAWIVRFLVENSLGRLWMANRPQSRLAERMAYYIAPAAGDAGAPGLSSGTEGHDVSPSVRVSSPEELRIGDSAVGAAHLLGYAFELLYAIYEEEGYNPPDIARLILEKNLYGMEIDPRSAALAAFALTMKARRADRRFLRRGVRPNICVLHSVHFTAQELTATPWLAKLGTTLADLPVRDALRHDLEAAAQLNNVGSLLRPQLTPAQIEQVRAVIGAADDLFTHGFNERVLDVLAQMEYLARKHHVVVANPPYLGKGMNEELATFAKNEYPDSKSDMFAMFIERNLDLAKQGGLTAMITMQSWMFLSSYEKLRGKLLDEETLLAMAHLGAKAFDSIGGEVVSTTAFVVEHAHRPAFKGSYVRLVDGNSEAEKETALRAALASMPQNSSLYRVSTQDLKKIPNSPIAYWASMGFRRLFSEGKPITE
ncbi:MAG: BREX-1 system adenine-specific DNA-methyltransferase PglX, partial [Caldilinea sp.]